MKTYYKRNERVNIDVDVAYGREYFRCVTEFSINPSSLTTAIPHRDVTVDICIVVLETMVRQDYINLDKHYLVPECVCVCFSVCVHARVRVQLNNSTGQMLLLFFFEQVSVFL